MSEQDKPIAIGTWQINCTLTDKRVVIVSGHLLAGQSQHDVDLMLDFYQDVLDRQAIRCDVQNKVAQLQSEEAGIEQYNELYKELAQRKAKGEKLTSQEHELIKRSDTELRNAARNAARLQADIAAGRKKLNGAAA